jgi:hypothetical protein
LPTLSSARAQCRTKKARRRARRRAASAASQPTPFRLVHAQHRKHTRAPLFTPAQCGGDAGAAWCGAAAPRNLSFFRAAAAAAAAAVVSANSRALTLARQETPDNKQLRARTRSTHTRTRARVRSHVGVGDGAAAAAALHANSRVIQQRNISLPCRLEGCREGSLRSQVFASRVCAHTPTRTKCAPLPFNCTSRIAPVEFAHQ